MAQLSSASPPPWEDSQLSDATKPSSTTDRLRSVSQLSDRHFTSHVERGFLLRAQPCETPISMQPFRGERDTRTSMGAPRSCMTGSRSIPRSQWSQVAFAQCRKTTMLHSSSCLANFPCLMCIYDVSIFAIAGLNSSSEPTNQHSLAFHLSYYFRSNSNFFSVFSSVIFTLLQITQRHAFVNRFCYHCFCKLRLRPSSQQRD